MGDGDRRMAGLLGNGEPRKVTIDRRLEVDSPLVDELQDRHRSERLADGTNFEERFRRDRLF
jgi:hypothetical protein